MCRKEIKRNGRKKELDSTHDWVARTEAPLVAGCPPSPFTLKLLLKEFYEFISV